MTKAARKLIGLSMSAIILAGGINLEAFAQEKALPEAVPAYRTADDVAADEWTSALRGAYLGNGTSLLVREDSTHVNIGGETQATRVCDEIELTLYLERSKSYATGYGTYKYFDFATTDAYTLFKEISNVEVERGYYYRVKGVHTVVHNGVIETTDSVTNPISYK